MESSEEATDTPTSGKMSFLLVPFFQERMCSQTSASLLSDHTLGWPEDFFVFSLISPEQS